MDRPDDIARVLYEDQRQGASDVSRRLESNTALGSLDFSAALFDRLALQDGLRLLDVGCGTGSHLTAFLDRLPIHATGVDPFFAPPSDPRITFLRASADALPFPDAAFERLMCNYTLYYVDDWRTAIDEMVRVVAPGGFVVITGPGHSNNDEFYTLHEQLFGPISEIDRHALGFLERLVEPYLKQFGVSFTVETLTNEIIYPTAASFLDYYTSTSLFRVTSQDHDGGQMRARIQAAIAPHYTPGDQATPGFRNTKKIRLLKIYV